MKRGEEISRRERGCHRSGKQGIEGRIRLNWERVPAGEEFPASNARITVTQLIRKSKNSFFPARGKKLTGDWFTGLQNLEAEPTKPGFIHVDRIKPSIPSSQQRARERSADEEGKQGKGNEERRAGESYGEEALVPVGIEWLDEWASERVSEWVQIGKRAKEQGATSDATFTPFLRFQQGQSSKWPALVRPGRDVAAGPTGHHRGGSCAGEHREFYSFILRKVEMEGRSCGSRRGGGCSVTRGDHLPPFPEIATAS